MRPAASRGNIALTANWHKHQIWFRPAAKPAEKRLNITESAAPFNVKKINVPTERAKNRNVHAGL
jgi:hypothetical protein